MGLSGTEECVLGAPVPEPPGVEEQRPPPVGIEHVCGSFEVTRGGEWPEAGCCL